MASGSVSRASFISQSETPDDGVKSYEFLADTKWWLHLQLDENYSKVKKLNSVIDDTSQEKPQDDHLLISENPEKLSSKMESQLIGINKTEPLWRKADLVSDESLEHFDKFNPQHTTSDEAKNLQELSKAELLEALCHSQTRAREAEKLRSRRYQLVYTHFPDFVPTKDTKRAARGSPRLKWGWSILGSTLAGAGFLLGWTLG
ncbi:hypothetical protein L1987_15373 [Smallanthus sonchifolius]|uniref:Uncharacterized protein n=1 Tax=Smallanthus sonchifolius TaxID=185202 RepID=A0ACB9J5A6_9ASTR|nr:hypothetical protein L1987_15373 [Smallanthus sonchifolius]